MMQSTFHLLLLLGLAALVVALYLSESTRTPSYLAPPTMLGAAFLMVVVAVQSSSVQVATDQGIETTSEPVIGAIATILAIIAFILALVMTIRWLPHRNGRRSTR